MQTLQAMKKVRARMNVVELEAAHKIREEHACIICWDRNRQILLQPCNHLCYCQECMDSLEPEKLNRCPICRSKVKKTCQIYLWQDIHWRNKSISFLTAQLRPELLFIVTPCPQVLDGSQLQAWAGELNIDWESYICLRWACIGLEGDSSWVLKFQHNSFVETMIYSSWIYKYIHE